MKSGILIKEKPDSLFQVSDSRALCEKKPPRKQGAYSAQIESSLLALEEIATKIRWIKGVLQFGYQWSNARKPSWRFLDKCGASSKCSQLKQLDARDDTRIEIEHSTDTVDLSTIVNSLSFPSRHEGSPATLDRVSNAGDSVGDQQERLVDKSSTQGCSNLHSPLNEAESTLACPTTGKSPSKEPCLPFEKHSAMWAFIESMELISRMRQQPHFLPLEQHSEVFREGMAISLMVTYSTMMNSIPRLKIANSRLKFDEYMNTLMHLEGHGFEIQHIRTRLEKLLRMKNDWEQLVETSSSLEVLMLDKEQERDKLNGEIERIDEVIEYLKRSLVVLNERSTSMLKQHEENDARIAELKMEARVVEEGMQSAECEFKRIIDSACCCS